MRIYYPENFFKLLNRKHLLLDTNVFIDSFNLEMPEEYIKFLNDLKDNDTGIITIDEVIHEFLKGSKDKSVYERKEKHVEDIIDIVLPMREINKEVRELILQYGADGGTVQMVDYLLGACLLKYKASLYLMTRDLRDFSQRIFSLESTVSVPTGKTIFTYGIYTFKSSKENREAQLKEIPF